MGDEFFRLYKERQYKNYLYRVLKLEPPSIDTRFINIDTLPRNSIAYIFVDSCRFRKIDSATPVLLFIWTRGSVVDWIPVRSNRIILHKDHVGEYNVYINNWVKQNIKVERYPTFLDGQIQVKSYMYIPTHQTYYIFDKLRKQCEVDALICDVMES
jgi:hypothetical protein